MGCVRHPSVVVQYRCITCSFIDDVCLVSSVAIAVRYQMLVTGEYIHLFIWYLQNSYFIILAVSLYFNSRSGFKTGQFWSFSAFVITTFLQIVTDTLRVRKVIFRITWKLHVWKRSIKIRTCSKQAIATTNFPCKRQRHVKWRNASDYSIASSFLIITGNKEKYKVSDKYETWFPSVDIRAMYPWTFFGVIIGNACDSATSSVFNRSSWNLR